MKRQLLLTLFVFIGAFTARAEGRAPAQEKYIYTEVEDLNQFLFDALGELAKSPLSTKINSDLQSAIFKTRAGRSDSPWTIEAAGNTSAHSSSPTVQKSTLLSTALKYQNKSGFVGKLEVSDSKYLDSTLAPATKVTSEVVTLSQDVNNMGERNSRQIQSEIDILDGKANQALAAQSLIDARISLLELVTNYYNTLCELQDLKQIRESISQSVKIGGARKRARPGSIREYLALLDLDNGFRLRIENIMTDLQLFVFKAKSYSAKMSEIFEERRSITKQCSQDLKLNTNVDKLPETKLIKISEALPKLSSNEFFKQSNMKQLEFYKAKTRASLAPFLSLGNYDRQPLESYNESRIGITFTYNFEGDDQSQTIKKLKEDISSSQFLTKLQNQNQISELLTLRQRITSHQSLLPIYRSNIDNSKKLLEVLKAQQSAGVLDALSTASAFLNYSNTLRAYRQAWGESLVSTLKLREYEAGAKGAKAFD